MKEFFKLAKLKIGLAIGIFASYFIEGIFYSRILFYNFSPTGEKIGEMNIGIKIIHYIFQTIFFPIDICRNIFKKLEMYFFDISDFFYFYIAPIFFLLLLIFYCYFLGCIAYFLIKKKGLTAKVHPERK